MIVIDVPVIHAPAPDRSSVINLANTSQHIEIDATDTGHTGNTGNTGDTGHTGNTGHTQRSHW